MPKKASAPGCKKTDPKCNEKLQMPAGPLDASTPWSKGKLCFTQTFPGEGAEASILVT